MNTQTTTLPNGFRVVTTHLPNIETVALGVWVLAGSRNETTENNGVAHFLEHMAFKGTTTRTAYEISQEIENVGGYMNAYTSREITAFYTRVLKDNTELAFDIIQDILLNPTFPDEEMEKERQVILQEIGQTNDTPDDIIFDLFQEQAYPNQALGRSILGPKDNIIHMPKQALIDFRKEHYLPHRMVLSVAGNVQHEQIVGWAEKTFGQLTKQNTPYLLEPGNYQGGGHFEERDLEQVHVLLGFQGVSMHDPNYYTALVFATLLGDGMSSRLFQEIREKLGLVYAISSFHVAYNDSGQLIIYAGTDPARVNDLFPVVAKEIKDVILHVRPDEIEKAKNILTARLMMGLESTSNWAQKQASQLLHFNKVKSTEEMRHEIEHVTRDQLVQTALNILASPLTFASIGNNNHVMSYEVVQNMFK